jgi:hypothetical protein
VEAVIESELPGVGQLGKLGVVLAVETGDDRCECAGAFPLGIVAVPVERRVAGRA